MIFGGAIGGFAGFWLGPSIVYYFIEQGLGGMAAGIIYGTPLGVILGAVIAGHVAWWRQHSTQKQV